MSRFDQALESLRNCPGLILDLREIPYGGNTRVARGILGRLIQKETGYQIHELTTDLKNHGIRRRWLEYCYPRGEWQYKSPVIALLGPFTASMGEGLSIALQGSKRALLAGSPMARLKGAVTTFTLPKSGLNFQFPTERLFRVDGTSRELCLPDYEATQISGTEDWPLKKASQILLNQLR